jgi:hypothetical protein
MKRTVEDEIWAFLDCIHVDEQTGCYLYTGGIATNGYGVFSADGRSVLAHRHAWRQVNGWIEDDEIILHTCDVRNCVNTEHMRLGTKWDNTQDMISKGRQNWSTTTRSRVTPNELQAMVRMRIELGLSWYRIGIELGRSQQHVKSAVMKYLHGPASNQQVAA